MPAAQGVVGEQVIADGATSAGAREGRLNEWIFSQLKGRYSEQAARGRIFSMVLAATTTGVAAGNIVAAAAAASTNFALFNPAGSALNYHLLKFGMGIISGTPGAGPLFHGLITGVPTVAATGTIIQHSTGKTGGTNAIGFATAGGTALTGGGAPATLRIANFSSTGTAQASVGELNAIEIIDGDIIIPPGMGWVPLWGAAGTTLLNAYSITWEQVPQ